mgnify:CR=1 FL=1|tara:strand:- start:695 stop:937 length:243 start_codon:yes stop_codon:yes gene_type:complete
MDNKQWHGGKGSKRRNSNEDAYADGWELAFGKKKPEIKARKEQPSHSITQVHKDKTKYNRRTKNNSQLMHEEKVFGNTDV